eukprot:5348731-Pleurochrysis_carterae.AAC.4
MCRWSRRFSCTPRVVSNCLLAAAVALSTPRSSSARKSRSSRSTCMHARFCCSASMEEVNVSDSRSTESALTEGTPSIPDLASEMTISPRADEMPARAERQTLMASPHLRWTKSISAVRSATSAHSCA